MALVLRTSAEGPEALFIERARVPGDPWSGQMALPGGRHDKSDQDLEATAKRETAEEVGLSLEGARLVGRLDDQTGQRAGQGRQLRIAAFVYEVDAGTGNDLVLNYEVAEAFWVPLAWFEDPSRVIDYRHPPYPDVSFPGVVVGKSERHIVWGLTFRFLAAFFGIVGRRFAAGRVTLPVGMRARRPRSQVIRRSPRTPVSTSPVGRRAVRYGSTPVALR